MGLGDYSIAAFTTAHTCSGSTVLEMLSKLVLIGARYAASAWGKMATPSMATRVDLFRFENIPTSL